MIDSRHDNPLRAICCLQHVIRCDSGDARIYVDYCRIRRSHPYLTLENATVLGMNVVAENNEE